MSENKKYYYLKLKDNFFESDEIIVLESMPDGYKYSNILLKLYLRSLKNEGKLMFNDRIPYNSNILAQVTRHSVGDVEKAVQIFKQLNLIEVLDNGAIYITDIQNFIGRSSTEGDRKREYRKVIESEQKSIKNISGQMSDKRPPEKEIELEIELEIDTVEKLEDIPYKEIVDYLNEKAGRQFRLVDKTKTLIKARWNEGQRLDDFKKVVDIKIKHANDSNNLFNETYLQPSTLFGNKFDEYRNQFIASKPKNVSKQKTWEEQLIEDGAV